VAILGIDILANDIYKNQADVHKRALLVFSLSLLLAFILAIVFSRGVTAPLKKVVEGTRKLSLDDLDYQVPVRGSDEISELARSFNKMTLRLKGAKYKLNSYFYNVLQSFVRIFEARDPYMRGHSERVADYSAAIAVQMGVPEQLVELLKEAALLHDVGKLGIQEEILNKSGPLTKDEWETVKTHPVIGEDILKPLLSDEILAIVRGHHERFDGKGYPDKLSGGQINMFLSIVAVADSYDAMTSSRPYRPAMPKEKAIEELLKNKGGQFHSDVVDAFLKILIKNK
jgi:HD-GYP domain-containing protein (c-di-GMP phosphodiesterase class II)